MLDLDCRSRRRRQTARSEPSRAIGNTAPRSTRSTSAAHRRTRAHGPCGFACRAHFSRELVGGDEQVARLRIRLRSSRRHGRRPRRRAPPPCATATATVRAGGGEIAAAARPHPNASAIPSIRADGVASAMAPVTVRVGVRDEPRSRQRRHARPPSLPFAETRRPAAHAGSTVSSASKHSSRQPQPAAVVSIDGLDSRRHVTGAARSRPLLAGPRRDRQSTSACCGSGTVAMRVRNRSQKHRRCDDSDGVSGATTSEAIRPDPAAAASGRPSAADGERLPRRATRIAPSVSPAATRVTRPADRAIARDPRHGVGHPRLA